MEELTTGLRNLKDKSLKKGIKEDVIRREFRKSLKCPEKLSSFCPKLKKSRCSKRKIFVYFVLPVLLALISGFWYYNITSVFDFLKGFDCLIENNIFVSEIGRPIFNCDICKDLHEVPVERNISKNIFLEKYAYTLVPVLIKDATLDWSAMKTFNFEFFRDIYLKNKDALQAVEDECQFFAWGLNTEFDTLAEALNMSEDRAHYKPGEKPWYFGWSNCHQSVSEVLREHYNRPYFLPDDSESSRLDWIFMGGQGPGAFMHLDNVERPSWQAQIQGTKTWTLRPAPECEDVCHKMQVTVEKGDIIVLDTNQWYHATYIHPGEISIVIGSEYD